MAVQNAVGLTADRYVMTNAAPTAAAMLDALADVLDPVSLGVLESSGALAPGGRCMDVGAGRGTVAAAMAELVAPGGEVYAVDLDPRHVEPGAGVIAWRADVTVPDSLPPGGFDVVHERLLLSHLPARRSILQNLVGLLNPGGLLVCGNWGAAGSGVMLSCPDPAGPGLYARYGKALVEVFAAAGNDTGWQTAVFTAMRELGLVNVRMSVAAESHPGGTGACALAVVVSTELQDKLMAAGLSVEELTELRTLLMDPQTTVLGNSLFVTVGWKPATAAG